VSRSVEAVDVPSAVVADGVEAALDLARELAGTATAPAADGEAAEAGAGADRVAAEADPVPGGSTGADAADDAVYVLGGGGIYELFQPHLDEMVLSHVDGAYEGDTYYPEWDEEEWTVAAETAYDRFTLREWVRRAAN